MCVCVCGGGGGGFVCVGRGVWVGGSVFVYSDFLKNIAIAQRFPTPKLSFPFWVYHDLWDAVVPVSLS